MTPLIKNLSDHTIKGRLLQESATAVLATGLIVLGDATAATQTVTIDGHIFQFYANGGDPTTVPAGRIPVQLPAVVTGPAAVTALQAAIQAQMTSGGILGELQSLVSTNLSPAATTGRLLLIAKPGVESLALSLTTTNGSTSSTVANGGDVRITGNSRSHHRSVSAFDVTTGTIFIAFSFNPIGALVQIRAADGSLVAWDGKTTFPNNSNVLALDNSGSVDWAANAKILVNAIG